MTITIHSGQDWEKMRIAGRLAAQTLDYITPFVTPGITTSKLNDLCHNYIVENGAIPAPLNYKGFPKSICTSVNHVICHGIPDERQLLEGDIVNIDVTVIVDGWYGDTSRMFPVGDINIKATKLIDVTYASMMNGIKAIKPGSTLGDIGFAINNTAEKAGFSVVKDFCGHGIGQVFHAEPAVLNYGSKGKGTKLETGMFFTVEPMVNAGKHHTIVSKFDGWTVTTRDKSLSAQFEHTVGITEDGYEIFTLSPLELHHPPYEQKNKQ
ncbi:type I methionyl aminopeptidase [Candidatus Sneabacter namystus]|uniref:Methionine aminopeptidase n=1 Tax=Candidatus Sneabacter namystus TaxID=2601646 RepID=A0A5C0UHB1_9RICK|nr:type I methionyl aminopeptidase [Candidatus Sneabacter namystus]QEK39456.1 type I methionyl aminopeptidase [Candidatus Sneabacter namystus]